MGNPLLFGIPMAIMAMLTILLIKNWKEWFPRLKKIGEFGVLFYFISLGIALTYILIKSTWSPMVDFFRENAIHYLPYLLGTISIILIITNYIALYLLFNILAPPSDNAEDEKTRFSALGWAAFIGGTLNFALVSLALEFGPLAANYEALDNYSREVGLKDHLTFAVTSALSCWSLIPLCLTRIRHRKSPRLTTETDTSV